MVLNFLRGGAAINVLARAVWGHRTRAGRGRAIRPADPCAITGQPRCAVVRAICAASRQCSGQRRSPPSKPALPLRKQAIAAGARVLATGDMGIGNTTASAAIAAVMTGKPVAEVTGFGTGLDDEGRRHKVAVIEEALALHRPNPADALDVLAKVGGLEIGAIAGIILAGAAARVPVVVDGIISTAGAAIADRFVSCRASVFDCRSPRVRTWPWRAAVTPGIWRR